MLHGTQKGGEKRREKVRYPVNHAAILRLAKRVDGEITSAWLRARSSLTVSAQSSAALFLHALYEPGEYIAIFADRLKPARLWNAGDYWPNGIP
jgi:hypothetical protein